MKGFLSKSKEIMPLFETAKSVKREPGLESLELDPLADTFLKLIVRS